MKTRNNIILLMVVFSIAVFSSCSNRNKKFANDSQQELIDLQKTTSSPFVLTLDFEKGNQFNHPLFALWSEDANGKYLETFYVSKSIGKGIFEKTSNNDGKWLPGPIRRPAALPYWAHKRGVKEVDGLYIPTSQTPMSDAVTGATPNHNFRIVAKPSIASYPRVFRLLFEINQSWDWNYYWSNSKYQDDAEYRTSSQPSVVYLALIDLDAETITYHLNPIGHGHYSGKNGVLYTDLSTLTTALHIAKKITVSIK